MSIRWASDTPQSTRLVGQPQSSTNDDSWVRPADWLTLPTVNIGDEKVVLLVAVWDLSHNWLAFACTGAYTVDWGDGSAPANVASGVKASHDFAWADIDSGTLSVHGYRQAIVTITPQAGQHLTSLSFSQPHVGAGGGVSNGTLEAVLAVPYATSFTFYNSATVAMDNRYLEHVSIVDAPSLITAYQMFAGMNALQKVDAPDATGAWTSTITNFSQMFSNCSSLREAPLLNTSAGTTFSQMFNNCSSLREVPLLNTSAGTNFSEMFRNCYSLREVPALNTTAGTIFSQMFQYCYSLREVPALGTAAGTSFAYMFNGCYSLREVPALNTAAGTNFVNMFSGCSSLREVPAFNTSAGTNFSGMFYACSSLREVPLLNTAAGTSFSQMFDNCNSLHSAPLAGTRYSINYTNCYLDAADLDAIYTALGTAAGAQTITVTGNPGIGSDDPSIATAKGWTVTGS